MARSEPSKARRRGVPLPFKRYKGKLIESVLFVHPEYIFWQLEQDRLPQFSEVYEHIEWCLSAFDRKPFAAVACASDGCGRSVGRYSLDRSSPEPTFWCAACEPEGVDGAPDSVTIHSTLLSGLRQLAAARPNDYTRPHRRLMKALLAAKGFDGARTPSRVLAYFHGK